MKKILIWIGMILTLVMNSNAVRMVTETAQEPEQVNTTLKWILVIVFGGGAIVIFIALVLFGLFMLFFKIYKKITEFNRKDKDILFYDFEFDNNQAHFNRDREMKWRNPKLLWVFWKRMPVYANTSKEGLKLLGYYSGETLTKEGYYMVSLYNKLSFFKMIEQMIVIPIELRHLVTKEHINGVKVMLINCEGVDRVTNIDFYLIPLVKNPKDDQKLINFGLKVQDNLFDNRVQDSIIKDTMVKHKKNIINAVESNPTLHRQRRSE